LPPELANPQGRRKWLREAQRRLDERRAEQARPIPRSRPARLKDAKRRFDEQLRTEQRANAAYEAYRAQGRMKNGRRFGRPPNPYQPPATPEGQINVTDPDSRVVKGLRGFIQGYNAQAVTNEHQVVLAADVMVASPDGHLEPMLNAAERELAGVGITATPQQMERITGRGITTLVRPDSRPGWEGGLYAFMRRVLASERGAELYRKRQSMIEPVFGDMKFNRGMNRFHRRGRAAVRTEWRLVTATHNLRG
jgi:hypothetical protein